MGKTSKAITKCCPFCEMQVAVACKTCPGCKHSIYNAKRFPLSHNPVEELGSRRRTERVKREKPNYYDASEFEKKRKKRRLERSASELGSRERGRPPTQALRKKRKKKVNKSKDAEDDDAIIMLSADKTRQFSIILAELNRKMFSTTWSV